jgi:SAM-dependent methyltransferase
MRTSRKGESSLGKSATNNEVESLDEYEASAKYYDVWHADFTEDIEFYLKLAERTGGPVLELMCGTGRVLIPFAQAGYEITGVDRSPSMLDVCTAKIGFLKKEEQERIDIIQDDVRTFKAPTKFKFAFLPFNSFLHLLETEDQEIVLGNIASHLVEGGIFSFSIFNPRLDRPERLLRHRGTKLTPQGEIISWFEAQTFDTPSQKTTVHYFYDISRQDKPLRRVTTMMILRYMFYSEAIGLLSRAGFEVQEVYGDYFNSPFKNNSELMVFVCRKV